MANVRMKSASAVPKSKAEAPFPLLKGVMVYCLEDIPKRDSALIYAGTEVYGGRHFNELDENLLTHIVTLGRCSTYTSGIDRWIKNGIKVILPEWFDDCFQLQLLCPTDHYLFPNPTILSIEMSDLLSSEVIPVVKETKPDTNPLLFGGKTFFFDPSFIGPSPDSSKKGNVLKLISVVENLGAKISQTLAEATSVVVEIQGTIFESAIAMNKEIGTKKWLRDQISKQTLLSPLDSCLHFPYPPFPLIEMKNIVITVSNYIGKAREDIFQMASRLGATTTRSMTNANTHLITACPGGEKYVRAHEWNTHIVNHLWIEDIYCKWTYQREAKPKYVQWPICIGQMVSQSRAIPKTLSSTGTPANRRLSKLDVESLQNKAEELQSNGILEGAREVAVSEHPPPEKDQEQVSKVQVESQENVEEQKKVDLSCEEGGVVAVVAEKYQAPPTGFGDLVDGFEAEKSMLEPIKSNLNVSERNEKKRPSISTSVLSPQSKKSKPNLKVMFTGIRPVEKQKKAMKSLGVVMVESITDASLLITHKIARTEKFLLAVTYGIPIVSEQWVKELAARIQIPNHEQYALIDKTSEADYTFKLSEALSKAGSKKLFEGYFVYFYGKLEPDWKTVKRLCEAAGATFCGMVDKKNIISFLQLEETKGDHVICFCSSNDDLSAKNLGVKNVYSTELLLTGLLKQEIDLKSFRLGDRLA